MPIAFLLSEEGGRTRAGKEGKDGVIILCAYIYIYPEEGTRMARAECEDGAIYIYPEEGTRMARAECEDGAIYICSEEGTRMARAECEDGAIHI